MPWQEYERVAAKILGSLAVEFGLERVDSGQAAMPGKSGTTWRLDAKGIRAEDGAVVVVECRRYPTRRLNQEALAGLAYRIEDIGAVGGIVVSPLPIQEGARLVAEAANIVEVQLDEHSTPQDFAMRLFGRLHLGVSVRSSASAEATFAASVSRRCKVCGEVFAPVGAETRCPQCATRARGLR